MPRERNKKVIRKEKENPEVEKRENQPIKK